MADDPNRDILPVKEGSCVDTCRSSIDPRERHFVCKLDRYQLEDRYLRLLEEANNLKKLSNCQEDKIKRLATKLMRVSANPRVCTVALDVCDDKNRITALELENSKLKDKISVLRSQLLSHTITGRSSSRSRNSNARPSSGRITCRSENGRAKAPSCQCIVKTGNGENDVQNYFINIEELEAQRKGLMCRVAQLEKELSTYATSSRREKVAENVEYIRVWRQMKQLNDKLIAAQDTNESLNVQINELKRILEETTKNNQDITAALVTEKKRVAEFDGQTLQAKDSQLMLREKDEQIRDLANEIKILQQHNNELIALSSKYGEVESENVELKKKVSEQLHDQQALKTAFNTEQANIVALQAANEQLLGKLQELQKNIDSLTVQLMSFQAQNEKREQSTLTQLPMKQNDQTISTTHDRPEWYRDCASQVEKCRKCCEIYEKVLRLEKAMSTDRDTRQFVDESVQTDWSSQEPPSNTMDQGTSTTPVKEKAQKEVPQVEPKMEQATLASDPLTSEKMLKLLEQAQISTQLDAARIAHKEGNILDLNQRHSATGILDQTLEGSLISIPESEQQRADKCANALENLEGQLTVDPNKVLALLFNILQEHSSNCSCVSTNETSYSFPPAIGDEIAKDINNNVDPKILTTRRNHSASAQKDSPIRRFPVASTADEKSITRKSCKWKKSCSNMYKLRQNRLQGRYAHDIARKRNPVTRFTETVDCSCDDEKRCFANSDCGYQCCTSCSTQSVAVATSNGKSVQCGSRSMPIKGTVGDSGNSVQKNFNTVYVTGATQNCGAPYRVPQSSKGFSESRSACSIEDKLLQNYTQHLTKCSELLESSCLANATSGIPVKTIAERVKVAGSVRPNCEADECATDVRKADSSCSSDCPNDCADSSSCLSDSFPLLITDGQGLVEIHILSLQLSSSAKQILSQVDNVCNVSLFISWDIWEQETARTPALKCPKLTFNSSFVYRISDLFSFFNCVLSKYVIFHVNVIEEARSSHAVARAKLCIKDILDYPQNKLHYIAPVGSVIPCSLGVNFGQLSLWVRLSCNVEKVEAFKKQCGLHSQTEYAETVPAYSTKTAKSENDTTKKRLAQPTNDLLVLKEQDPRYSLSFEISKDQLASFNRSAQSPLDSSEMSQETSESVRQSTLGESALAAMRQMKRKVEKEEPRPEVSNDALKTRRSSSAARTMDNEDDTSDEGAIKSKERPKIESKPEDDVTRREEEAQAETTSIVEFNAFLATTKSDGATARDSDSTIRDMNEVLADKNWEQYKQRSLLTFASTLRPNTRDGGQKNENDPTTNCPIERDTIIIEIVNVVLFQKSSAMHDGEVRMLYIEYSFLGYYGADMETISVEKPKNPNQKMTYNFRKKFRIDEETHGLERDTLRAMLKASINPNIRFVLVSEPLPEETNVKECVEIGIADFNMREYALGNSHKIVSLPIMTPDHNEQIGTLKIFVLGLDAIRQCLGEEETGL